MLMLSVQYAQKHLNKKNSPKLAPPDQFLYKCSDLKNSTSQTNVHAQDSKVIGHLLIYCLHFFTEIFKEHSHAMDWNKSISLPTQPMSGPWIQISPEMFMQS